MPHCVEFAPPVDDVPPTEVSHLTRTETIHIALIAGFDSSAGWRMSAFTFSNLYDTKLYFLLWVATGFWCYAILQLPLQVWLHPAPVTCLVGDRLRPV